MDPYGTEGVLELGQDPASVAGESSPGGGERDEAASVSGWVRHDLEQSVAGQARHEVLCRLAACTKSASERRRGHAVGIEVREHEGLRGSEPGPASLLEPVQ